MNALDIISAILDSNGGDYKQTILCVNEFASELLEEKYDSTWGRQLLKEIEEFAIHNGKCPNCGQDLSQREYFQESEFLGNVAKEKMTEIRCKWCNFEID